MIDAPTKERLAFTTPRMGGAYIVLPLAQLDQFTALLDRHKVDYSVDEESLSLDGKPEIIRINRMDGTDPDKLQRLLDSFP
jgi:hypothetical protein